MSRKRKQDRKEEKYSWVAGERQCNNCFLTLQFSKIKCKIYTYQSHKAKRLIMVTFQSDLQNKRKKKELAKTTKSALKGIN